MVINVYDSLRVIFNFDFVQNVFKRFAQFLKKNFIPYVNE